LFRCEICGNIADKHHIVHRSQGGADFPLNIKYLCHEHHRGKYGPHKNKNADLQYKLQLQKELEALLNKEYYKLEELAVCLQTNKGMLKKLLKNLKLNKEGYKASEIVYRLMGNENYQEHLLKELYEFPANF